MDVPRNRNYKFRISVSGYRKPEFRSYEIDSFFGYRKPIRLYENMVFREIEITKFDSQVKEK